MWLISCLQFSEFNYSLFENSIYNGQLFVPVQMYIEVLYCLAVDITACPPTGAMAGEQGQDERQWGDVYAWTGTGPVRWPEMSEAAFNICTSWPNVETKERDKFICISVIFWFRKQFFTKVWTKHFHPESFIVGLLWNYVRPFIPKCCTY